MHLTVIIIYYSFVTAGFKLEKKYKVIVISVQYLDSFKSSRDILAVKYNISITWLQKNRWGSDNLELENKIKGEKRML